MKQMSLIFSVIRHTFLLFFLQIEMLTPHKVIKMENKQK